MKCFPCMTELKHIIQLIFTGVLPEMLEKLFSVQHACINPPTSIQYL